MGGQGELGHRRDIRRHLGDDGNVDGPLDIGGVEGDEFGVLAHVAAHAGKAHLRAGKVQFHGIDPGLLGHLRQLDPLLLRLSHDGGDDDLGGIVLLEPLEDVEVHLHRILRQLLHVAEAGKAAVGPFHGVEAGRNLLDVLQADGLVEHARPARFQGRGHHLVVRADGGRSQEEGILAVQAAEVDLQGRQFRLRRGSRQRLGDFPQANRPVVVDASLLGGLQVRFAAFGEQAGAEDLIVKADGPHGAGGIPLVTGGGTRGIFAKQAPDGFLLEVELVHGHGKFLFSQI